ncbi:MAG TPA: methyl-accepting chemotaxis protein [Novimethylophilus sp.]|uniref:methyl-accepting chemotaxis protein n=1 Tax=Novimethylophilus sp. TaxID=2137426 RepID=UPI002F42B123
MTMPTLSIRSRLIGIQIFMGLGLVVFGTLGMIGMYQSNAALEQSQKHYFEPSLKIGRIMLLMSDNRTQLMFGLQHNPESAIAKLHDHPLLQHLEAIAKNLDRINGLWSQTSAVEMTVEEKDLAAKYETANKRFIDEGLQPSITALNAGDYAQATSILLLKMPKLYSDADNAAQDLLETYLDGASQTYELKKRQYVLMRNFSIGAITFGLLLAFVFGYLLIRSIVRPLDSMVLQLEEIAAGNLDSQNAVVTTDEIGKVAAGVEHLQSSLREMIDAVTEAAKTVSERAEKLNAKVTQVNAGSQHQQDMVSSISAAMQQMASSIHEVAGHAQGAAKLAEEEMAFVNNGSANMERSVTVSNQAIMSVAASNQTMKELSERIAEIGKITGVIQGIADQTNLLALNAAIEAARAGEQGRGFAVVADEVRTLAERTTQSTHAINNMVQEVRNATETATAAMEKATDDVAAGAKFVEQTGQNFAQIRISAQRVTGVSDDIALATQEQSTAAEGIAQSVEQISIFIAENGDAVADVSAISSALDEMARQLNVIVASFHSGETTA